MKLVPNRPPAPMHVTAFLDGRETVAEPHAADRVDSLEKVAFGLGSDFTAEATLLRKGRSPRWKRRLAYAKLAFLPALAVGTAVASSFLGLGFVTGAALTAAVPAAVFGYNLTRLQGPTVSGLKGLLAAQKAEEIQLPTWKGKRVYEIRPDRTGQIDSPVTSHSESRALTGDDIQNTLIKNFRAYPGSRHVVYALGHGLGYHSLADMKVTEWAHAIEGATAKTGVKPETLVLESCLMGNLEALNELRNCAQVAVVSEETMTMDYLPLNSVLRDAAASGDAHEMGRRMVNGIRYGADTYAAVDLQKVGQLTQSLDELGRRLSSELHSGAGEALKSALSKAQQYPQGKLFFHFRNKLGLTDMKQFLDNVGRMDLQPETREALTATRGLFKESILASHTEEGYHGAGGISFQARPKDQVKDPETTNRYTDLRMPIGWNSFLRQLDQS